jgi:alkanesulfonate monooxygenase SsuD/methylene tetrahydromethanopterin reductase-like flavin-dependent oxidoreductase (luciferase family)
LDWIRGLAKAQGRELSYGIRLHVISRDTGERAWSEAQRLLSSCRTSETSVLLEATSRSITGAAPPKRGCDGPAQPTMSPGAARAGAAIEAHGVAGQSLCIGPADVLWSSCDCSDR